MTKGKIYGVSLGPGDPGLITVKGLEIIRSADRIFFPGSLIKNGTSSYSETILKYYNLDGKKLEGFYLSMNGDASEADKVYEQVFRKALRLYEEGSTVVFVSEGDISFYSTFIYILLKFQKIQVPVSVIPGVSSIMSAGAEGKFPIAWQDEKVAVLPRMKDAVELRMLLEIFDTIVFIKIRSIAQDLFSVLMNADLNCLYCERLGTDKQYVTQNLDELAGRDIPYFSLLIIRKK